jgi:transcriptional regulator with PAS, ATPase and Fis domain
MRDEGRSPTLTTLRRDAVEVPGLRVRAHGAADVPVGLGEIVIGSAPDCDVVLDHPTVSRRHCALGVTERGVRLRDLGSKNGTRVGDVVIADAFVPADVDIHVGDAVVRLERGGAACVVSLSPGARFGDALGGTLPMRALFAQLERIAPSDEPVLLLGESGTGKEILARALHAVSPRAAGPFVVLDCGALPPGLAESALFGHVRGAFTGAADAQSGVLEQAHGGTLFIDELGELPLDLQPKLLRALEERQYRPVGAGAYATFDARVVAATHRDLVAGVAAGTFRQDLYYRIAVVSLRVPPLRERKDDIPLLVERFLAAQRPPRLLDDLQAGTLDMLRAHDWPGNVRELRNTIARLVLLGDAALPPRSGATDAADGFERLLDLGLREARDLVVERFEGRYLRAKLDAHGGNVTRAADAMGVSRQFLHRLIERYRLER